MGHPEYYLILKKSVCMTLSYIYPVYCGSIHLFWILAWKMSKMMDNLISQVLILDPSYDMNVSKTNK